MSNQHTIDTLFAKHMTNSDGRPRFTQDEVDATLPPFFIYLLTTGKWESFGPEIQEGIALAMASIGVGPKDSPESVPAALEKFSAEHPPSGALMGALFEMLHEAGVVTAEEVVQSGQKLKGETAAERAARTPKLGEKAPEGAIKVDKLAPKRRI